MSSDEEDSDCPLCMEELDIADRNFRPCTCGYQVIEDLYYFTTHLILLFGRSVVFVGIISKPI